MFVFVTCFDCLVCLFAPLGGVLFALTVDCVCFLFGFTCGWWLCCCLAYLVLFILVFLGYWLCLRFALFGLSGC